MTPPPFRRFGSKVRMSPLIVEMLGAHQHYVETFAGSAAVLFAKPRSAIETINDLDGEVVNVFKMLREQPEGLSRAVALTPYSREEYKACKQPTTDDPLERARCYLVRSYQCIGNDRNGGWSRVMECVDAPNTPRANVWRNTLPGRLLDCAERLRGVQIESRPWEDILDRFDRKGVVMYVDPPYMEETRAKTMGAYACEMTTEGHERLVAALKELVHAKAVVSHYPHPLYDTLDWAVTDVVERSDNPNKAGVAHRTERLYSSVDPTGRLF